MTISILAFGVAREIIGGSSVSLNLDEGASAADLKFILEKQYPSLLKLTSFMIAVNNEYAQPSQIIIAGDEVAIIPPVSGG
jgi:molybdopterin synthase sulfur carrier subunit